MALHQPCKLDCLSSSLRAGTKYQIMHIILHVLSVIFAVLAIIIFWGSRKEDAVGGEFIGILLIGVAIYLALP
jgi:succinate-acetate transporter protein